jgi:hypothetical protein
VGAERKYLTRDERLWQESVRDEERGISMRHICANLGWVGWGGVVVIFPTIVTTDRFSERQGHIGFARAGFDGRRRQWENLIEDQDLEERFLERVNREMADSLEREQIDVWFENFSGLLRTLVVVDPDRRDGIIEEYLKRASDEASSEIPPLILV